MFGPNTFMLYLPVLEETERCSSQTKHHSSEAFKDNMHVKLLQTSALLLQLVVETMIDVIITQMKWLNEALTT